MGKPAARVGDLHTCPIPTHVGGPVAPPGHPTVWIGGLPAATVTTLCTCIGPPDMIIQGSASVFINSLPAARMGDATMHGGLITMGCFSVFIGDAGAGSGLSIDWPDLLSPAELKAIRQTIALKLAASSGAIFCETC
ncbi:PAAR domain-containing protein [Fibrella arboris]|uniref:PAAR domain-containing protein n=1 Tax=Fibrella arboris TaxID=3242486 RepID=UPI0035224EF7